MKLLVVFLLTQQKSKKLVGTSELGSPTCYTYHKILQSISFFYQNSPKYAIILGGYGFGEGRTHARAPALLKSVSLIGPQVRSLLQ